LICGTNKYAPSKPEVKPGNGSATGVSDDQIPVYFGAGCFWHFQHEFVDAERNILKRTDDELTAFAGFGGSK